VGASNSAANSGALIPQPLGHRNVRCHRSNRPIFQKPTYTPSSQLQSISFSTHPSTPHSIIANPPVRNVFGFCATARSRGCGTKLGGGCCV
jgi:hypothetical protein